MPSVNFRNSVIIMTSNIGSLYLLDGVTDTGEIREDARERWASSAPSSGRSPQPVGEIVLFKPLTLVEIDQIVDPQIADVRTRGSVDGSDSRSPKAPGADRQRRLRPRLRRQTAAPLHPARGGDADRAGADRRRDPRRRDDMVDIADGELWSAGARRTLGTRVQSASRLRPERFAACRLWVSR